MLLLAAGCGGPKDREARAPRSPRHGSANEPEKIRFEAHELDRLRDRAREEGRVSVIVRLDVDHTPEGELSEDGVKRQRKSIRAAQDQLLAALRDTDFDVIHRFTISPLIGLMLSPDAVEALEGSSALRHVSLDVPDRPASTGSSVSASSSEGSTT